MPGRCLDADDGHADCLVRTGRRADGSWHERCSACARRIVPAEPRPVVLDTTTPDSRCADCGLAVWAGELLAGLHDCPGAFDGPDEHAAGDELAALRRRRERPADMAAVRSALAAATAPEPARPTPAAATAPERTDRDPDKGARLNAAGWAGMTAELGGRVPAPPAWADSAVRRRLAEHVARRRSAS